MKRTRWATGVGALAVVGLLVGCAGGPPPAAVEGGTVTIRIDADWGNPIDGGQTVTSATGMFLAQSMYSTLVYLDPETGEFEPYLAESWEQGPSSVTFTIKDGVTCSDGTPVTASTVYDSFERFISPELGSSWLSGLFGNPPYRLSKDDEANTFTFGVDTPNVRLLPSLADPRSSVICGAGLEPGADFTVASYGTGPYVFESAIQGDEYVVTKREGWDWGPHGWTSSDSGFPDELVFKVITDATTAANSLVTGSVDFTTTAGPDVDRLAADPQYEHNVTAAGASYMLMLNHAPGRPTADDVVREAVITALDPEIWTIAAGEPDAPISTNVQANPGGYCYTDLSSLIPTPSVDDARAVLLDDGYVLGSDGQLTKDGAPLVIEVLGSSRTGPAVETIADTLQQVGISVTLTNVDYTTFAQRYGATDYDVVVGLHGGEFGTASRTALFMTGPTPSEGGNNRLNRVDPEMKALADAAYGATTPEEACEAWEEFNTYVLENWVARPWASAVSHWFTKAGEFSYVPLSNSLVVTSIRRLG